MDPPLIKGIFNALYGDVPARFSSEFPLTESVARLRERTGRSIFASLFHESAVGPVTESRVRLQRVIPFFGNSFKPIFAGAFRQKQGRVFLEGRFTMFLFSKVFMTIWLTFALMWTIVAVLVVLRVVRDDPGRLGGGSATLLFPIIGLGFFVVGIVFIRFCWWLSRSDIAYLSSVIQQALAQGPSGSALGPEA